MSSSYFGSDGIQLTENAVSSHRLQYESRISEFANFEDYLEREHFIYPINEPVSKVEAKLDKLEVSKTPKIEVELKPEITSNTKIGAKLDKLEVSKTPKIASNFEAKKSDTKKDDKIVVKEDPKKAIVQKNGEFGQHRKENDSPGFNFYFSTFQGLSAGSIVGVRDSISTYLSWSIAQCTVEWENEKDKTPEAHKKFCKNLAKDITFHPNKYVDEITDIIQILQKQKEKKPELKILNIYSFEQDPDSSIRMLSMMLVNLSFLRMYAKVSFEEIVKIINSPPRKEEME